MPLRKPKWLIVVEPIEERTVCSWCGVRIFEPTLQEVHEHWHRAVGVVPLDAPYEDDV